MKKQFDTLIFIGRFQPFHNGHKKVIERGLELADNMIVFIGSANQPRTIKNPFTFQERKNMLVGYFLDSPIEYVPLEDYTYNDKKWVKKIQENVEFLTNPSDKIGLIGHSKDSSSYYLKMFPNWKSVEVENIDGLNATDIRNGPIYNKLPLHTWKHITEYSTRRFIREFWETYEFDMLLKERDFIRKFKESWKDSPYPPTFITADTVVTCSNHILLIERKHYPGKGTWALPGGYINQDEKIVDSAIRELREETKLKVPEPVLYGSIKSNKVFDHPERSERGRIVTHAYHIDLGDRLELPKVKGSDDAAKANWIPLNKVERIGMFEDHKSIIDEFLNIL